MTTTEQAQPTNDSEWQLYRVLQRANLLQYYDTFVAQGGDDVPQLCEAGEEEFLEIMALVGMASKPLHVRRLQKALQEWVANPAAFQCSSSSNSVARDPPTQVLSLAGETLSSANSPAIPSSSVWNRASPTPQKSVSPVNLLTPARHTDLQPEFFQGQIKKLGLHQNTGSPSSTPCLSEEQILGIAESATRLVKDLPTFEPKHLSQKKDINKQILEIISLPIEYSNDRLELMRKYAAIYRRFDSDRSYSKPMSQHEVCVNEAAAQLCYHMPNLLTRREDLFPLSRQVVKESGYQYSKGHSRSTDFNPENPSKRQKFEVMFGDTRGPSPSTLMLERETRQERLKQVSKELGAVSERQEELVGDLESAREGHNADKVDALQTQLEQITNKHLQLLTEQCELLHKQSRDVYVDIDGASDKEDSNIGASGSSSPGQTELGESSQHMTLKTMLTTGQIPKSSLNSLSLLTGLGFTTNGMNNSLFDEGLRIAQQYGLGDFAQELKTLQGSSPTSELEQSANGDNVDDNDNRGTPEDKASSEHDGESNESLHSYDSDGVKNQAQTEETPKRGVKRSHSPSKLNTDTSDS